MTIQLSERQVAIIVACVSRCSGWDDPPFLERFLSVCADAVPDGFTAAEMEAIMEYLAGAAIDAKKGIFPKSRK